MERRLQFGGEADCGRLLVVTLEAVELNQHSATDGIAGSPFAKVAVGA